MSAELLAADSDLEFAALIDKIEHERDFQGRSYKEKCLRRRVAVRMRARGMSRFAEYAACLDHDPVEYDRLITALTINVTKLFRNASTFDTIGRVVIPVLAEHKTEEGGGSIDVWSAGCASGEEAFSLAILFHRAGIDRGDPRLFDRVQVIGTDIDHDSLEAARRGRYDEASFSETPAAWRERYFTGSPRHEVIPEIRRRVRFERRDLLEDASPLRAVHLIACRNALIYFHRQAQEEILVRFHEALAPGGYLVLGRVEMLLGRARTLFTTVDARERIFRRK